MTKTTKKKTKKIVKKNKPKTVKTAYISHLHVNQRLALTIWAQQVPDKDICCLGMSLVHKDDSGSRLEGRKAALKRCLKGLTDFDQNQKSQIWPSPPTKPSFWQSIVNLFKGQPPAQEIKDLEAELDAKGIIGGRGCWLVKGIQNARQIVMDLRFLEACSRVTVDSQSIMCQDTRDGYYEAFFRLPNFYFGKDETSDKK